MVVGWRWWWQSCRDRRRIRQRGELNETEAYSAWLQFRPERWQGCRDRHTIRQRGGLNWAGTNSSRLHICPERWWRWLVGRKRRGGLGWGSLQIEQKLPSICYCRLCRSITRLKGWRWIGRREERKCKLTRGATTCSA